MKEFPPKGWYRTLLDRLIRNNYMLMVQLTGVLVAVVLNPSERLIQHRRRAGLDLQSERRSYASCSIS